MPSKLTWPFLLAALLGSYTVSQDVSTPTPPTQTQSMPSVKTDSTKGSADPQPSHTPEAPLRIGGDVKAPKVQYDPEPSYSDVAKRAGFQATVVLWLIVDSEGHTKNIRIVSGAGMGLEEQAVGAVRTWRFQPATRNGQAVPVMINVEVNFRLYGPRVVSPLFPGRESKMTLPQFPGADLVKYPLLVFIKSAYGVPVDNTYEVVASGTIEQPVKQLLSITCNNKKHHCPYIQSGRYPARWLTEDQSIEIIGKETPDGGWKKAEYTVKSEASKPPM